jgi:hypothetical protein
MSATTKNLLELCAYKDGFIITMVNDQFSDNSMKLKETFVYKRLDVIIDDAIHSDESVGNTFDGFNLILLENFYIL